MRSRHFHVKDLKLGPAIGAGTFSVVRQVTVKNSGDGEEANPPVALKMMKKAKLLATSQVDHVKTERHLLQQFDCRFIVAFLSSFQDERRIFMLLEYAHAGEIYGRLRREGRLPVADAKFYTAEILMAFEYLQGESVAFRDLKAENVLIDWQGHIKLTDFGFAKVLKHSEQAYTLVGTPEYLAPEIIKSVGHNARVDYWALGILIFEMLAGYPPFWDKSPFKIFTMIVEDEPTYVRHMDVKAVHLVKNLLQHDVDSRYDLTSCMLHSWLDFIQWDELKEQEVQPPWRPKLDHAEDVQYFDVVPNDEAEDKFDDCLPVTNKLNKCFVGVF